LGLFPPGIGKVPAELSIKPDYRNRPWVERVVPLIDARSVHAIDHNDFNRALRAFKPEAQLFL
jgi:hypothetical protein